jgi:FKBP-type peptidyl-prolyl cis-trans isomerase FkpA
MKLTLFTLFLLSVIGFASCRKSSSEPDIKQYDQQQIQNYIAANGITGMQRDLAGGDTTGIYYKILTPGTGAEIDYPDTISYVYTIQSFDRKYAVNDTVLNHFFGYLGHVAPNGLMLAIRNDLKYRGGKMRVLVPSHLAYGTNGVGSGSSTVTNNRIAGNQCLDFTINLISRQDLYDDMVINNYINANGLTGYTKMPDGLWYKITKQGTGNSITINSTITANYRLNLMNNTFPNNDTTYVSLQTYSFGDLLGNVAGVAEGMQLAKGQGAISLIVPSRLAYGPGGNSGIPANACLRWDFYNIAVTNY